MRRNHQICGHRSPGIQFQKSSELPMVSPINGCRIKKAQYVPMTSPRHGKPDCFISGQHTDINTVYKTSLDFFRSKIPHLGKKTMVKMCLSLGVSHDFWKKAPQSSGKPGRRCAQNCSKFFGSGVRLIPRLRSCPIRHPGSACPAHR